MRRLRRLVSPALPWFDRRVDWRVDARIDHKLPPRLHEYEQQTLCHYARQEGLNAVADDVNTVHAGMTEMLFTMKELRRWMVDNLDAAADTATLVGESLTRLQASVDRLGDEIGRLSERMAALETAPQTAPR